ncbi:MAG TPA: TonB family protein, partial [Cystobacter sp.]
RMGEATSGGGERERWAWALVSAALIHAGVLILGLTLPQSAPRAATLPEEPEVVFFSFPPPPAAASSATASHAVAPERVQRQARTRAPRTLPTLPVKTPVLEQPVEAPVETANPETQQEPAPAEEVASVSPGVEGVVAGIVGGVIGGREGGLLGATGGEALELKQVARAPEVLAQVKPRYPRRAKADGIEGLVLVRIIIGTDGRVEPEHTRVIRSVPELDAAAISAVSQWRFSPAIGRQGRPVRVIVEIPVQFSLK